MGKGLEEMARGAAELAAEQLRLSTFGAIASVALAGIESGESEGLAFYTVSWAVPMLGDVDERIRMVILPEYIEGEDAEDWLPEQMSAYITEQALGRLSSDEPD